MSFVHPAILLVLWCVPPAAILAVWARRRSRRRAAAWGAPGATRADPRFAAQLALWCAGAVLAIIAAARPQWGETERTVLSKGRNVVLAVDVSRSMLAEDVHPNRLERARVDLRDLLAELEGDRAALVAFRGKAVTLCPLTTDGGFLRQALDGMGIDSAPRGETDLGSALDAALDVLEPFAADHNAVVLVSDGEDLSGHAHEAADRAAKAGIPVFTVGIGDPKGATVPLADGKAIQFGGSNVVSRLDNATLDAIAKATGGAYIPLRLAGAGSMTLGTLYRDHLRRIAAQDFEEKNARRKIERYQIFLLPALLCFLAIAALSTGRPVRRRKKEEGRSTKYQVPSPKSQVRSPKSGVLVVFAVVAATCASLRAAPVSPLAAPEAAEAQSPKSEVRSPESGLPSDKTTSDSELRTSDSSPGTSDSLSTARAAQAAFRAGDFAAAAAGFADAAASAESPRDAAAWSYNAALARLRSGDAAGAAESLRTLAATPDAPPATQEALAVALYEAAQGKSEVRSPESEVQGPGGSGAKPPSVVGAKPPSVVGAEPPSSAELASRLALLEESAAAFQQAASRPAAPDNLRRNLAAVSGGIPALREEARLARIQEQHGSDPPEKLLAETLKRQREIRAEAAAALADDTPAQIGRLEAAARHQREAADLWVPLAPQLSAMAQQAVTNEHDLARLLDDINGASSSLTNAAAALEDFDPAALSTVADAERRAFGFLTLVAAPDTLLAEAIPTQSNAVANALDPALPHPPAEDQSIAAAATALFAERFPAWADQLAQQPGGPGAEPPPATGGSGAEPPSVVGAQPPPPALSAEDRAEIERLAAETVELHQRIQEAGANPDQTLPDASAEFRDSALANLLRIQELMPRQQNQQQQQQNQQQQSQDQQQSSQDQQNQQQQDQNQKQDQEQQQQEQPQEQQSQDQQQEQQEQEASEAQETPEDQTEREAKALLQRMLDAEKEREEQRRLQQQNLPPRLHERDW